MIPEVWCCIGIDKLHPSQRNAMRQECAANGKGACAGCGILFARRSGGNPKRPSMCGLVLLGTILRQAQDKLSLRNNNAAEPHIRMIPTTLTGPLKLNVSCNAAGSEARVIRRDRSFQMCFGMSCMLRYVDRHGWVKSTRYFILQHNFKCRRFGCWTTSQKCSSCASNKRANHVARIASGTLITDIDPFVVCMYLI